MTALVIAEYENGALKPAVMNVVTAARRLGQDVDVLLVGESVHAAAAQAARLSGVARVLCVEGPDFTVVLAEPLADAVVQTVQAYGYTHLLFVSSSLGKAAMPRVAALLDVAALSDITAVVSPDTFERFIYAGGVQATVRTTASPVVMSVRATAFEPVDASDHSAPIAAAVCTCTHRRSQFVALESTRSDRPDLLTAKRVVAGGRGLIDEDGFAALDALAQCLGAAVGSTRAAVDMGLSANDTQVGQTGKIVAPELYMAFGISGAIQHVAGMKASKVIVAVNKDPEAPIFGLCDYYLVADAQQCIGELTEKLH